MKIYLGFLLCVATPVFSEMKVVHQCVNPNAVAITFDDGPYKYTQNIVDQFNAAGANVTFFVNGLNYGCIYDYAGALQNAYRSGHQIASHTWSHPDLTTLTNDQISTQ